MTVGVLLRNSLLQGVFASVEAAKAAAATYRAARAGEGWRPIGGDPDTATAWSSPRTTNLMVKAYDV